MADWLQNYWPYNKKSNRTRKIQLHAGGFLFILCLYPVKWISALFGCLLNSMVNYMGLDLNTQKMLINIMESMH